MSTDLQAKVQQALQDEEITATQLLIRHPEFMDDDPAAIEHMFRRFGYSGQAYNKYMAGVEIIKTNRYWKHLPSFLTLAHAITYGHVYAGELIMTTMEAASWSVVEAVLLCPDVSLEECEFTDDIKTYIVKRAEYENQFGLTLSSFIDDDEIKKIDSPHLNTWLVTRTQELLGAIKKEFKRRHEEINLQSINDLRRKLSLVFPPDLKLIKYLDAVT
jgi:hypothetical protein